jgi:hypothetical protein
MEFEAFELAFPEVRESLLIFACALFTWLVWGPPQAASMAQAAAVITIRINLLPIADRSRRSS